MNYIDWIFAAFVIVGSVALSFIGDYPEYLQW